MRNLLGALAALLVLAACGGNGPTGPSGNPSPTPIPTVTVGGFREAELVPMRVGAGAEFLVSGPGKVEMTVTFSPPPPDARVEILLLNSVYDQCGPAIETCSALALAVDPVSPQKLTYHVDQSADKSRMYFMYVRNRGTVTALADGKVEFTPE